LLFLFKRLPFMVTGAPFLFLLFVVTIAFDDDMRFLGRRNGFYIIYVNTKK